MKRLCFFLLLASYLLLASCISSTDYERLVQDVNDLKRNYYETDKEMGRLKEKTDVAVKEDSFAAVRESQTQMNARISELTQSLQELRGRFEEYKYFTEKSFKESAAERELLYSEMNKIENNLSSVKSELASDRIASGDQIGEKKETEAPEGEKDSSLLKPPPAETESPPPPVAQKDSQPSLERTEAYESAYADFKERKFKDAREKFEDFIKKYAANELTDNAQFWIAETYYSEEDFEGAILAYEVLQKKYPESEKIAGALLKQGFAFIEIGDNKTGKIILERLIEKFPDSKEAEVARTRLADRGKKSSKK